MGRKRKSNTVPKVHEELTGLDLRINEFGEIISNIDIDKVNAFLTKEVPDKKLINRRDDAYQQEFKKMGLGGDADEEDLAPFEEETAEEAEEEDIVPFVADKLDVEDAPDEIKDILEDDELPPEEEEK
jgi:hypothetical protein